MLKDIDWPRDLTYSASSEYLPIEFYLSSFSKAKHYDLLLGYFSTSAISKLSLGFATFIKNGGSMRLVINHILSDVDREVIKAGLSGQVGTDFIDVEDPAWLSKVLSQRNSHFFDCIAWLIHNKRIDIKIIRPKYGAGISHYKQGIVSDGVNKLSFIGSCNFTYRGLVDNLESLRVTLGWHSEFSKSQVESDARSFERIFNEEENSIEYLSIDKTIAAIVDGIECKDIED